MHSDVNQEVRVPDDNITDCTNGKSRNTMESVGESTQSQLKKATVELNFMHNENDRIRTTQEKEKVELRD